MIYELSHYSFQEEFQEEFAGYISTHLDGTNGGLSS